MLGRLKLRVFAIIRNFCMAILRRVDEAFLVGSSAAPIRQVMASQGPVISQRVLNTTPTLVVNEGDVIAHASQIEELFKSIFHKKVLGSEELELQKELLGVLGHKVATFDDATVALRKYLLDKVNSTNNIARYTAWLKAVLEHESMTQANKRAYIPAGRENSKAVFWPDPTFAKDPRSLFGEKPYAKKYSLIDRSVPIGSAGSCFAIEIALRLQRDGYNYVVSEKDPHPRHKEFSNSCARWGIIFNSPSFRQLIEKAFGERELPPLLWSMKVDGKIKLLDPFREDVLFDSVEEYEADRVRHIEACREALMKCEYFAITLGVNEVWSLKSDGSVFSRAPWRISSHLVEHRVMTVEENLAELESMLKTWRKYNPKIKLIVTVSPVPLHATFRGDEQHVVVANAHSKASLRVVAEEFCRRNEGVYYFPSYEVVMYCTKNAWEADQRHVSAEAVDGVMNLFEEMYLK